MPEGGREGRSWWALGRGGRPVGAPVPAFQSPITGMCRDAPARDYGARLTGLETGATAAGVLWLLQLGQV